MVPKIILENLIYNQNYSRQVYPFLSRDYFDGTEKILFAVMENFYSKYNAIPSKQAIDVELNKIKKLSSNQYNSCTELLNELKQNNVEDINWLIDKTEEYCKNKALYNAISDAIEIQSNAELPDEEKNKKIPNVGAIPEILTKALSVGFDRNIGHDYWLDAESRYDANKLGAVKIPFKFDILNKITHGGVELGTLNLLLGGTNVGKTLGLVELAKQYIEVGHDVLYITLEISENKVGERIDANILDTSLDHFDTLTKTFYLDKLKKFKDTNTAGKLIIKQYPTGIGNVINFRSLLNDLKLKKGFTPSVIIVDYLGICGSSKIKFQTDSYSFQKSVAEELRGLGIEYNCAVWSAVQTSRGAWTLSSFGLEHIADSAAVAQTADFVLAVIETDELIELGQQLFIQLKSRYADKAQIKKIFLGVSKAKQSWYELDNQPKDVPKENKEQIENQIVTLDSVFSDKRNKMLDAVNQIQF